MNRINTISRVIATSVAFLFTLGVLISLPKNIRQLGLMMHAPVVAMLVGIVTVCILCLLTWRIARGGIFAAIAIALLLYSILLGQFVGRPMKMGVPRRTLCVAILPGVIGMIATRKSRHERPSNNGIEHTEVPRHD